MSEHDQPLRRGTRARSEGWSRLLDNVSSLLDSALDLEQTMRVVARLPVPNLADFSELYLSQADGGLRLVEHAQADPEQERRAVQLQTWYADHVPAPVMRVAISHEPLFAPVVSEALLSALARDSQHLSVLRKHRPRSLIVVPIRCGDLVAALALGFSVSGRQHDPADLMAALELARRAGSALRTATRHHAVQEDARARNHLLRVLSRSLRDPLRELRDSSQAGEAAAAKGDLTQTREALESVRRLSDHLSQLVEELFVEPAAPGPRSPKPLPMALEPLLRHAWERARYPVGKLQLEVAPQLPAVELEPERMSELLRDLMEDACLEAPPRHPLEVSVGPCDTGIRIALWAHSDSPAPDLDPTWWSVAQQVAQSHRGHLERLQRPGCRGYALTLPAPVFGL